MQPAGKRSLVYSSTHSFTPSDLASGNDNLPESTFWNYRSAVTFRLPATSQSQPSILKQWWHVFMVGSSLSNNSVEITPPFPYNSATGGFPLPSPKGPSQFIHGQIFLCKSSMPGNVLEENQPWVDSEHLLNSTQFMVSDGWVPHIAGMGRAISGWSSSWGGKPPFWLYIFEEGYF